MDIVSIISTYNLCDLKLIDFDIHDENKRREEFSKYNHSEKKMLVMIAKINGLYYFCSKSTEKNIIDVQRRKLVDDDIEMFCPYCMERLEVVNSISTYVRHEKNIGFLCPYKRDNYNEDSSCKIDTKLLEQSYILLGYFESWIDSKNPKVKLKDGYILKNNGKQITYTFKDEEIDKSSFKVHDLGLKDYLVVSIKTLENTEVDFILTGRTLKNDERILDKYKNGNVILYEILWSRNVRNEKDDIADLYEENNPTYDELYSMMECKAIIASEEAIRKAEIEKEKLRKEQEKKEQEMLKKIREEEEKKRIEKEKKVAEEKNFLKYKEIRLKVSEIALNLLKKENIMVARKFKDMVCKEVMVSEKHPVFLKCDHFYIVNKDDGRPISRLDRGMVKIVNGDNSLKHSLIIFYYPIKYINDLKQILKHEEYKIVEDD